MGGPRKRAEAARARGVGDGEAWRRTWPCAPPRGWWIMMRELGRLRRLPCEAGGGG